MKHILFIEDDEVLMQPVLLKLRETGYSVSVAKTGKEGLTMALSEHPDLILLDILLPEMDGRVVLKNLREDSWEADIPVIVLTNLDNISLSELPGVKTSMLKANSKLEEVLEKIQQALA